MWGYSGVGCKSGYIGMMEVAALESPEDFGMVGCFFGVTRGLVEL
jgi:hypothetical protein